jgi:hypothetical protein
MALGLLASLFVQIGLMLLQRGLATFNGSKRQKASPFESPTADEGRFIPIVYGQFALNPNVVLSDVERPVEHVDQTTKMLITDYFANLTMTVCHGPVDEISDIVFGGKSLRGAPEHAPGKGGDPGTAIITPALPYPAVGGTPIDPDTPTAFVIEGSRWFGGGKGEGGIGWSGSGSSDEGAMRVYWGGLNQPADQLAIRAYDARKGITSSGAAPGRPSVCCIAMGTTATNLWRLR